MTATIAAPDADLLRAPLSLLAREFAEQLARLPNGDVVAYRRCGRPSAGLPIVLLHGISSGAASWLQTALLLGESNEVIAWDAPGYGESSALQPAVPTDIDYAARLRDLLSVLGLTRCVLVGHSLGALMAAAYVRQYSNDTSACQVERLVLISPAGGYGGARQAERCALVRQERHAALHALGVAGLAIRTSQRLLSPQARPEVRAWVRRNAELLRPEGYLQAIELLCNSDLSLSVPCFAPVAVFCGDADIVTTPAACLLWAQAFCAPFALLARCGHASPSEQPQAVAHAIVQTTSSAFTSTRIA